MVPCSLIGLVDIGLISIDTMDLASGIVTSSHLTYVGLCIIVWSTLRLGCYEATVRRLISGLIPGPIRCIGLSIRHSIRWSIRRSIRWYIPC